MWTDFARWMRNLLAGPMGREEGQALVEYSLILALVSIAVIAALTGLAGGITTALGNVIAAL